MQAEMVRQLLFAGVMPLVITMAVIVLIGRCWRSESRQRITPLVPTVAVLMSLLASRLALDGWPDVSWERLVYGIGAAGVVAIIWSMLPRNRWITLGAACAGGVGAGAASLGMYFSSDPMWLRIAPIVAIAIVAIGVDHALRGVRGPVGTLPILLWLFPAIGVIILSGNVSIAMTVVAALSAMMAIFLLMWWRSTIVLVPGSMLIIISAAHLALTAAWLNSFDLPSAFIPAFILVAVAPLGLWLGKIPILGRNPAMAHMARIIGVGALAIAALVFALSASDLSAYA